MEGQDNPLLQKMSSTSRGGFNMLPDLLQQESEKHEANKRKAQFILQAMTTFSNSNGVSPLQGFGSLPKFQLNKNQKTGHAPFGLNGSRLSMQEVADLENVQTAVNDISAKRAKGMHSPALERSSNLTKDDVQRKNMNES